MIRNPYFRLSVLIGFFFMLGFTYRYHLPKIENYLLVKVEHLSQKHSPVRIWAKSLDFHLLPLGIVLNEVKVLPQKPMDRYLAPSQVKEMGARLAVLPLLRGEVRLARIFLRDADLNVFLRSDLFPSANRESQGARFDFEEIYRLPIDEIALENVRLQGKVDPQNVVFRVSNLNFLIENRYRSLFVELAAPLIWVKPSGPTKPLTTQLELRTLIEANEMQVSAFKLKADESFVVASGRFNGEIASGDIENGAFDARAKIHLADLNIWERVLRLAPHDRLPAMTGRAEVDLSMEIRGKKGVQLEAEIQTQDVKVDKFFIGDIQGKLDSDLKTLKSEKLTVRNSAGQVTLKNVLFEREGTPHLKGTLLSESVQIKTLLAHLGVGKVPVEMAVNGEVNCDGKWSEKPELNCQGKVSTPRVWIYNEHGSKRSTIVEAHQIRGYGDFKVTKDDVTYKATVEAGAKSKGRTHGVIHYDTGFKIQYEGDTVDFADVKNLSNLKFEGVAKITGKTEGTASWGTLELQAVADDFWMEDYPFGHLAGKISYKSGLLRIDQVEGQYGVSRYQGRVDVDLLHDRLQIQGTVPFVDLADIQSIFQRKVQLPFSISGTGTGRIEAHGPFSFPDMSYTVQSRFFRGEVARENFDEFVFNVRSVDGLVTSERIHLTKATGVVDMKGQITPKGVIDSVLVGRGLRLEQSENVMAMGLDLQGVADITMLVRGQLPKPRIELNGRLSRMVLSDMPSEDSVFKLNFLEDRLEGVGQFLGPTIAADIVYPYTNDGPFRFKAQTRSWDFTSLFSMVSKTAKQMDFSTSVSGEVDLSAPKGGFWAASGRANISEFSIRKGAKVLAAQKPMTLTMQQGEVNSNSMDITSGDSYIKILVDRLTRDRLNASLNGKVDLSLLGLFTPFISDLRGQMAISMDLSGKVDKASLSGSAYVEKGYAKLTEFTHPFSNVRADVIFNGNQVLLNSVSSDLAGGRVRGDGKITFDGKERPIDIKGTFMDVKINVPEGFRTQGSGSVAITGKNFPYTMAIDYSVTGGEVVYEIGQDVGGTTSVRASSYLPKFMYQETFHPFTFDIDVNLRSPVLVNNSLIHTQVSGQVKTTGTPDRLLLTGTLAPLPGGKVFFKDTPFEISTAFVEYNNNPPSQPRVYMTANARVSETVTDNQNRSTEHQFDINLLVQGRGPEPQILLSSQPPLSQRELVSLLALGVTGGALDEKKSNDFQAANTSTAVGAAILQKAGGRKIKENFGVDVKVSSSAPTPDTASTPKVTLSKQWTPKLGASASSTLKANPANSARIEYKMNKHMSVVGSWDGKENTPEKQDTTRNVFGLDLEYKVQFK